MMRLLNNAVDRFFGRGQHGVTVPGMDGALQPNELLEEARSLAQVPCADNIAATADGLVFSSGQTVYQIARAGGAPEVLRTFTQAVNAITSAPNTVAFALADGSMVVSSNGQDRVLNCMHGASARCITALAFGTDGRLFVANGSSLHTTDAWIADLMELNANGSVWAVDVTGDSARCLASDLAWPAGIISVDGRLVVSEAWRNRLILIPEIGGKPVPALADLPGYPGRIAKGDDGSLWLAVFAPRSQLIEFVLREHNYRNRMIREVPRQYWIGPALASGRSFLEPLQGGAVKQLGILKPWSPTRSYGLVIKLNGDCEPVTSFHSRADGKRHGVTSVAVQGKDILITSYAAGAVLLLNEPGDQEAAHAAFD